VWFNCIYTKLSLILVFRAITMCRWIKLRKNACLFLHRKDVVSFSPFGTTNALTLTTSILFSIVLVTKNWSNCRKGKSYSLLWLLGYQLLRYHQITNDYGAILQVYANWFYCFDRIPTTIEALYLYTITPTKSWLFFLSTFCLSIY
jgi:hypothetical protein